MYAVTASFRSFVHVFHASLTRSNESDSVGSCLRMSSLPTKIDSRYIHLRCTPISISTVSEISESAFSQRSSDTRKAAA